MSLQEPPEQVPGSGSRPPAFHRHLKARRLCRTRTYLVASEDLLRFLAKSPESSASRFIEKRSLGVGTRGAQQAGGEANRRSPGIQWVCGRRVGCVCALCDDLRSRLNRSGEVMGATANELPPHVVLTTKHATQSWQIIKACPITSAQLRLWCVRGRGSEDARRYTVPACS